MKATYIRSLITLSCGLFHGLVAGSVSAADNQENCIHWADFSSTGQSEMLIQGTPSASKVNLKSQLIFRHLKSEQDHKWIGLQLFKPINWLDGKQVNSAVYSVPFAVRINSITQQPDEYIFNAPLKDEDKGKLIGLYSTLHISKPSANDDPSNYLVNGADDIGVFTTRYNFNNNQQGTKTKLRYSKLGSDNQKTSLANVESATIHLDTLNFKLDTCGLIQASGNSDIEVSTKDDFLDLRVKQSFKLKRRNDPLPKQARIFTLDSDPKKWKMLAFDTIYPRERPNPLASGKDFILSITSMNLTKLTHAQLKQLLYDNQDYLHLLKDVLLKELFSNKDEARLFLVLGMVDVPQSHALLTDIYLSEDFRYEARFRTLMALKYAERPIEQELIDRIFTYSTKKHSAQNGELAHSSMMVLGIITKNQLQSEFGQQLSNRLINELNRASSESGQAALLTAIGNSGDTNHQKTLTDYLSNDSSLLRERSAKALYHMPSQNTLQSLSNQLSTESNAKTKQAILRSMGPNPMGPTDINKVYTHAKEAPESNTRRAAISALVKQKDHQVDVKPQLKSLIKSEKTEANLRDIMKALYSK